LELLLGDALGVPVEFISRKKLRGTPLKTMIGYGTHNVPRRGPVREDDYIMQLSLLQAFKNIRSKYLWRLRIYAQGKQY
jgi:ADP-ribosylglycohydrolase